MDQKRERSISPPLPLTKKPKLISNGELEPATNEGLELRKAHVR